MLDLVKCEKKEDHFKEFVHIVLRDTQLERYEKIKAKIDKCQSTEEVLNILIDSNSPRDTKININEFVKLVTYHSPNPKFNNKLADIEILLNQLSPSSPIPSTSQSASSSSHQHSGSISSTDSSVHTDEETDCTSNSSSRSYSSDILNLDQSPSSPIPSITLSAPSSSHQHSGSISSTGSSVHTDEETSNSSSSSYSSSPKFQVLSEEANRKMKEEIATGIYNNYPPLPATRACHDHLLHDHSLEDEQRNRSPSPPIPFN